MNIAVLGAGSWGTALAVLLARNGHEVVLLGRNDEEMTSIRACRENLRYLPGFAIPDNVSVGMIGDDAGQVEMTVVAVPSGAVRSVVANISGEHPLVVVASKGLETGTSKRMTEVIAEALPGAEVGTLSGPNLAIEIVRGIPTAAVTACNSLEVAERVRSAFMYRSFRVYLSEDVIGVELAGSLKNVLAIGAGMSDGLGFGDNTKGALLARGLNEMTLLGLTMGAKIETFMGLAGVGDLFATAASTLSRNYRVGRAIGSGALLQEALDSVDQVAEGVVTSECAQILSRRYSVSMPVFEAIEAVLRGRIQPRSGVEMLMERTPKTEGFHFLPNTEQQ